MRCFLDTEYTNTDRPLLISVGLVAEDGREFYAEATDGWSPEECSPFVIEHVLPHLGKPPAVVATRAAIRATIASWLSSFGEPVTIIYDLRADWQVLGALFDDLPNRAGLHGQFLRWRDPAIAERFQHWTEAWFTNHGPRHNALIDARGFCAGIIAVEEEFGRRVVE